MLRVFGVSSASLAVTVPKDLDAIAARGAGALVDGARATAGAHTFKVRVAPLRQALPAQLVRADRRRRRARRASRPGSPSTCTTRRALGVEVGTELSFVTRASRARAGRAARRRVRQRTLLLSGGIDSPVAGWLAAKRGCALDAVYFHSPPYIGEKTRDKVLDAGAPARRAGRRCARSPSCRSPSAEAPARRRPAPSWRWCSTAA